MVDDATLISAYDIQTISPNPTFHKTNILPLPKPTLDELLLNFENEENARLCSLMQVCSYCVNPAKNDALWTKFKRRFNSRSRELKKICYKDV